eukprot:CAMPEP_0116990566 /NCGR_PEP_ID=MMETSP0467-20121206/65561_1 /TAXON_ID=283647 /ORGANISM="Mesodinium pulex, Strain SPMC105" /LENGTH=66 /DNA_ID=CAMNT_0004687367 /DNA_START=255 /DNA_END=455 /DNA_ORIENTATION=-
MTLNKSLGEKTNHHLEEDLGAAAQVQRALAHIQVVPLGRGQPQVAEPPQPASALAPALPAAQLASQ